MQLITTTHQNKNFEGAAVGIHHPILRQTELLIKRFFLDGGFDAAREFILREFSPAFGTLSVLPTIENPKGELQELLQERSPLAPEYQTVSATGPDHDRVFECVVRHGGLELARGSGKSKKAAESDAALSAMNKLRGQ